MRADVWISHFDSHLNVRRVNLKAEKCISTCGKLFIGYGYSYYPGDLEQGLPYEIYAGLAVSGARE